MENKIEKIIDFLIWLPLAWEPSKITPEQEILVKIVASIIGSVATVIVTTG